MRFTMSTIRKDLRRWRQDTGGLILWLSMPLVIGGLITSMMDAGGGAKPRGVLLIADQDESMISGLIAGAYGQGDLGELITVEKVSFDDGDKRINAGEASGFLLIPEGFGNAFFELEPVSLTLKTNPAQTILPGIIQDVTEILLDAGFYVSEFFGPEIQTIKGQIDNDEAPDSLLVSTISVAINNKIEVAAPRLFPPVFDIDIVEPPPSDAPDYSYALLYLPGIILMTLMFSANGIAHDFWVEREQGTLRRLVFAPGIMSEFLAGKALAAGIVITVIGGVTLVLGFLYHGIAWSRLPSALAWIAISGIALFAWFGALQMLAGTRRAATVVSSLFVFPLLMAGGSFFPLAALPEWIARIGKLTPNGFVADRLTTEIIAGSAWSIDPVSWLIVALMAATGLLVCGWRLRSGFARG
jgi:ABC-type multidrug transport system permease subunit